MNGPDVLEILWAISRGESGDDRIPQEVRVELAADGLVSLDAGRPLLTSRAVRMLSESEAEVRQAIDRGSVTYVPRPTPASGASGSQSRERDAEAAR